MGTSGTLCIQVPGRKVTWYNNFDSYPDCWGAYIIAELRMLFLLYTVPEVITLVNNLQPIDLNTQPTAVQLAAFAPYVTSQPDGRLGHSWVNLLRPVRMSLLATLSIGWYQTHGCNEEYNYCIDFTDDDGNVGVGRFECYHCNSDEHCIEWQGLEQLPVDVYPQLVKAAKSWQRELNGEEAVAEVKQTEEDDSKTHAAVLAHEERGETLRFERQFHEAVKAYEEAIQLSPVNTTTAFIVASLYVNQAIAYMNTPQAAYASTAMRRCHKAIAVQPSTDALGVLAWAREALGMRQQAIVALRAALAWEAKHQAAEGAVVQPHAVLTAKLRQLEAGIMMPRFSFGVGDAQSLLM